MRRTKQQGLARINHLRFTSLPPSLASFLLHTMVFPQEHTAPIKLDTNANNFERNMKDKFLTKAVDVGELQHIIVRKTSGGLGGDWHLAEVEVWHPGTA